MALMCLSTYLENGFIIWVIAILLHIGIIITFTKKYAFRKNINLFTSDFIVYVSIGMAAITGVEYNLKLIPSLFFYFSFISMIILMIWISYRYLKMKTIEDEFKPLICIYSAPFSFVLLGYLKIIPIKSLELIAILFTFSLILYIFAIYKFIQYRNLKFYPSYSAYTFPFVITALASSNLMVYLNSIGINVAILEILVAIETIIAILLVAYVLAKYLIYFYENFN